MADKVSVQDEEILLANLCLAGVIAVFIIFTFMAFLLTDGKAYCVIPLLRRFWPTCKWVDEQNRVEKVKKGSLVFKVGTSQHVIGVKKPCRQV